MTVEYILLASELVDELSSIYSYIFDPAKLGRLIYNASEILQNFNKEIMVFVDFLNQVGDAA